jgi:hypothetical protein
MRAAMRSFVGKFGVGRIVAGAFVLLAGLRLVDIAYDAKTLWIVAEAQRTAQATVTALPKP